MIRKIRLLATLAFALSAPAAYAQQADIPPPPGTVHLSGQVYMDKTEVANIHWLEYLHYLKQDSATEVYTRALPDTSVWDVIDTTGYYKENYLRDPAYRYHALTGISYQQALAYCEWREKVVNQKLSNEAESQNQPLAYRVHYRLPTIEEWEQAAAGGLAVEEYPFGMEDYLKKPDLDQPLKELYYRSDTSLMSYREFRKTIRRFRRKGRVPVFNCVKSVNGIITYSNLMPENVHEQAANPLNIHGMIGNVAEMVATKGIAKGGSFLHACDDCRIPLHQVYRQPAVWLGFRCVAEVELLESE